MKFYTHLQFEMTGAETYEQAQDIAELFANQVGEEMNLPVGSVLVTDVELEDE